MSLDHGGFYRAGPRRAMAAPTRLPRALWRGRGACYRRGMLIGRKKITDWRPRLVPFVLTPLVLVADQLVKLAVLRRLPRGRVTPVIGDLVGLVFVQNPAIGFSIGKNLPAALQRPLFIALNFVVVTLVVLYSLFTRERLTASSAGAWPRSSAAGSATTSTASSVRPAWSTSCR